MVCNPFAVSLCALHFDDLGLNHAFILKHFVSIEMGTFLFASIGHLFS